MRKAYARVYIMHYLLAAIYYSRTIPDVYGKYKKVFFCNKISEEFFLYLKIFESENNWDRGEVL